MNFLTRELMLQLIMLVPVLAIAGIIATGRSENIREAVSIIASLVVLYLVTGLYSHFKNGAVIEATWAEILPGLSLAFRLDAMGMLFALIASVLWLVTIFYAIGYMRSHHEQNQTRFYACFALAIASVFGVAFASNLFTLFIFYEVLTLSTYPLVTHAGTEEAKKGGRTYLGILLTTSIAFLLFAVLGTYAVSGTLEFTPGGVFPEGTSPVVGGAL